MGKIYFFYGDEKYDLELRIQKIKKEFKNLEIGLNLIYITSENIKELENICQGVTFFGTEKLIIIKDTKLQFNINYIIDLDEDSVVIIVEDSVDKRTTQYKALVKISECIEFKYMDIKAHITYIMQTLNKYDIQISHDCAQYMQSICGIEKSNILNELQKLVIYLKPKSIVTKDIIDTVCSKTLNAKIFDVLSKIINKQKIEAINSLDDILMQKESIVKIYIMLYKQIKQMYMIKYLKDKNATDIQTTLGIHPFVFKNLNESSTKYKLEELKNIMYSFDEYDCKTKNGEMDFVIGLKKIICSM
ncbi:MAG: DNA polymerase III subunit delta [Clostridia bacterium]